MEQEQNNDLLLLLVLNNVSDVGAFCGAATDVVESEPALKNVEIVKDLWVDEVEQGPELLERVLNRRDTNGATIESR
jgi:hypothetical protein